MATTPEPGMFAEPPGQRRFPAAPVAIAAVAMLILAGVLLLMGRRHGRNSGPLTSFDAPAAYNGQLAISNIQMSEATNLAGGKSTYIDGHIANNGAQTVTGATVEAAFANSSSAPQVLSAPVQIIRMREPEVDVEPLGAAPLKPGAGADFRLIFEDVSADWNEQQPEMRIVAVSTQH